MNRIKELRLVGADTSVLRRIDSLTHVKVSPHFKFIAALNGESYLSVIHLVDEERSCSSLVISQVESFEWHLFENADNCCTVAVLASDESIQVHELLISTCTGTRQPVLESNVIATISKEDVTGLLMSNGITLEGGATSVRLLHFANWAISLLINVDLVCVFIVGKRDSVLLSAAIRLQDVVTDDQPLITLAGGFIFHLCVASAIVYIYRLNGGCCASIDVRKSVANHVPNLLAFDIGPLTRIAVSPAVDYLVIVDQQGASVCICLRDFLPSAVICSRLSLSSCTGMDQTDNSSLAKISTLSSVGTPSVDSLTSKYSRRSPSLSGQMNAAAPTSAITSAASTLPWLQSLKKDRKSLTGFRSSQTSDMKIDSNESTFRLIAPPGLKNVHDVEVSHMTLALWEKSHNAGESSDGDDYGSLTICNLEDSSVVASFRFSEPTYVVLRSAVNLPYLIVTADSVDAVSINVKQEEVISKFMFYENAAVADLLAKLNSWECIAMPLNVLELALRNHQIDAILFFLKSQEDVSCECNAAKAEVVNNVATKGNALMDIASLLATTIMENMIELGSKSFAEQLLQISMAHLNKILQNALSVKCHFSNDACTASVVARSTVTHLIDLRKYLKNLPIAHSINPHASSSSTSNRDLLLNQLKIEAPSLYVCWNNWRLMNEQEIIYDAIWNRCMPLAEAFCATDLSEASVESNSFYDKCLKLGLDATVDCLESKDIKRAVTLLRNLGCGVSDKLRQICFNTANKDLRRFLVEELKRRDILSQSENKTIAYLDMVEQIYPCQSFERAREMLIECRLWTDDELKKFDRMFTLPPTTEISSDKLQLEVGTVGFNGVDNCQSTDYCCLTFEWTKSWSAEIWERIIIEGTQANDETQYQEFVSTEAYWRYLLSRNDLPKLLAWLNRRSEEQQLSRVITFQMVEDVQHYASPFVANCVLDELAKLGIFCSREKADIQALLLRLVRINSSMSVVDVFSLKSTSISALEFQDKMIRFCLHHNLPLLLYENMERFGSLWNEVLIENDNFKDLDTVSWLTMMVHFRNWIRNPKDQDAVFKASLSNAEFQLKLQQPTVNEILKAGSVVVGMATLLCAPGTLRTALEPAQNSDDVEWKVDVDLLKSVISKESALGSSISQFVLQQKDPPDKQDVNVYGLLRDNVPFDVGHLFGWQPTNTYKASDCFPDLPYFSHPELVNKYGHVEDLDFTYYLKQGRPSFAYAKFVSVQILSNRQNGAITNKEIIDACNVSHSLAIQFFYKQEVAAACVAFMEMLSFNTRGLRIDLQVACTILAHQNDIFVMATSPSSASPASKLKGMGRMNEEKIAELLMNAVTGGKLAFGDVLNYLEKAVSAKCALEGFLFSSVEGFLMWSLPALFCRRHNSPVSNTYLKLCAQQNEWIMFTLFAEVHAIPKHQVMQMIQHYPTDQMKQHLKNAFSQLRFHSFKQVSAQIHKVTDKKSSRDLRANLYARIGVSTVMLKNQNDQASDGKSEGKASDDDACSQCDSIAGSSDDMTDQSATSSLTSGELAQPFSAHDVPSDLLSVLLYCNQYPSPWKSLLACAVHLQNPVLSVMAACYQESSILDCLCVWLHTSCQCSTNLAWNLDQIICQPLDLDDLKSLIIAAMKQRHILLLIEGFYYFQPESPLYDLFRFLKLCIHDKVYEAGSVVLKEFQNSMSKTTAEVNGQIVGNLMWFQDTVIAVINETILLTSTPRECIQFLNMLNSDHFLRSLINSASRVPDYMQLLDILQLLLDTDVKVDLGIFLLPSDSKALTEECNLVLDRLLSSKQFEIGYKFVAITGLPRSSVVIAQLREELQVQCDFLAEGSLQGRLAIWNHCSAIFRENYVPYQFIADFFAEYGLKIQHPLERFYVLHLAWTEITAAGSDEGVQMTADREQLEREMWLARIAANVRNVSAGTSAEETMVGWDAFSVKVPSPAPIKLKSSMEIFLTAQQNIVQEPYRLESDAEKLALDKIICQELDNGHIDTAYRISQLFDHKCISLNIVLTCLKLAEGTMALHHLDVEMRILLEKGSVLRLRKLSSRRISLSSSRNSLNTGSFSDILAGTPSPQTAPAPQMGLRSSSAALLTVPAVMNIKQTDEVMDVMEKLVDHCEYGVQCSARIIVCYNIASVLGLQYLDIVQHFDDAMLLKAVLQSDFEDRFFLAKEYILSSDVDDAFIASFLCEHIFNALRLYMGQTSDEDEQLKSISELILKPTDSPAAFIQLAKLCKDPSLLGSLLLSLSDVRRRDHVQLSLDVELCIRAHSCFTVACHVEGITRSLHKAKRLCKTLTEAAEFSLMVRLLTGIGRFSEMTYIFDILRENHQFELLFRKGMEKVPDLKMALLDYVRRFHPVDIETFTMISLHFSMYREIACMLLSDANTQINLLDFKNRKEKPILHESLENIMQLLADAAESFSKADCMQQSINCTKQAELVALQLYLISSDVQVMCLGSSQVSEFIANNSKFYESLIVADAYARHKDWAQALFNNFVVKNDAGYLRDLQETISISTSLLEEVARRYQMSTEKNNKMMANLKHLLSLIDEIQPKYYLAIDLGFDDVVAELLQGDGGSFLKDVMQSRKQW